MKYVSWVLDGLIFALFCFYFWFRSDDMDFTGDCQLVYETVV